MKNIADKIKNCIFVVRESFKLKNNATNYTKTKTRIQGKHNGESPPVCSKHCFDGSRSDFPTLFNFKLFKMRESKDKDDSTPTIEEKEFERLISFKKKS